VILLYLEISATVSKGHYCISTWFAAMCSVY